MQKEDAPRNSLLACYHSELAICLSSGYHVLTLNLTVVLAMSIWNDAAQQMAWLDSGNNGPCQAGQGTPANIQSQHSDTHVVFSNIRWGEIGSTQK